MKISLDTTAMFKLSYGLYCLTAQDSKKYNGCIVNTVVQLTSSPLTIAVCVNKSNHTHDLIMHEREFNISVLTESTPFSLFQRFGFACGRDTDKFAGFNAYSTSANGLPYLTEHANAFLGAVVTQTVDCGTHTMFIARVTQARVLNDEKSVTYEYYFAHIKPAADTRKKKGWVCKICGYVHEGEDLPEDFICPICKHPASDFEPIK